MARVPCGFSWMTDTVSAYVNNASIYTATNIDICCTAPGVCGGNPSPCPYGYLSCQAGNSRYACTFLDRQKAASGDKDYDCYQEGSLVNTRKLPCCPSMLTTFLTGPGKCLSTQGFGGQVCCLDKNDASSCQWATICLGYTNFQCMTGDKTGVCSGYNNGACVQEYNLDSGSGCAAVSPPSTGCTLGGSGPVYYPSLTSTMMPPSPSPTASSSLSGGVSSSSGPSNPMPTKGNSGQRSLSISLRGVLTLCFVAPLLTQMLFL